VGERRPSAPRDPADGRVRPTARKGVTVATEELEHDGVDQADAHVDEIVADDLVEDVSIDGMCGVY